jgi:glycosyltransferase involved in cell wall biosynthesis
MDRPLFTVFTATHDRAHTLSRPYQALRAQSLQDFEWLIVDDGSTDGTEALTRAWQRDSPFAIRYLRQVRGGKHRAFNVGVREATGTLFLSLDSDDGCVPWALERLQRYWQAIPEADRDRFTGVTVLAQDPEGNVIGDPFPGAPASMSFLDMMTRHRVRGDKWGFHRTAVLREFPFPEFEGELFMSEGVVWHRIAQRYHMRFVNDPLLIAWYQPDGLSARSIQARVAAPRGAMLVQKELADSAVPVQTRLWAVMNFVRFGLHAGEPLAAVLRQSGHPALATCSLPVAAALLLRDRRHTTRVKR